MEGKWDGVKIKREKLLKCIEELKLPRKFSASFTKINKNDWMIKIIKRH